MRKNLKTNRVARLGRLCTVAASVLLPVCLSVFSLLSCESDAYEKGEGDYSLLRGELADVHVDSNKKAVCFDTDASERITIDRPFTSSAFTTADSIYRLALYYKAVDVAHADVLSMNIVAVMRPHKMDSTDVKTDPVRLESMWLGQNRRYLNGSLYLMVGSIDQEDRPMQVIGVLNDTLVSNADGSRTQYMRLYHDQAGMPQYYSQRTYVSIPLQDVDADSICLRMNTYDGIVTKRFSIVAD